MYSQTKTSFEPMVIDLTPTIKVRILRDVAKGPATEATHDGENAKAQNAQNNRQSENISGDDIEVACLTETTESSRVKEGDRALQSKGGKHAEPIRRSKISRSKSLSHKNVTKYSTASDQEIAREKANQNVDQNKDDKAAADESNHIVSGENIEVSCARGSPFMKRASDKTSTSGSGKASKSSRLSERLSTWYFLRGKLKPPAEISTKNRQRGKVPLVPQNSHLMRRVTLVMNREEIADRCEMMSVESYYSATTVTASSRSSTSSIYDKITEYTASRKGAVTGFMSRVLSGGCCSTSFTEGALIEGDENSVWLQADDNSAVVQEDDSSSGSSSELTSFSGQSTELAVAMFIWPWIKAS